MEYNVLLVDDEYMIINGLKKIIAWKEAGFIIKVTARNAKEASHFEFMILSEYQKFHYLKSGLQLGAINYLIKPV